LRRRAAGASAADEVSAELVEAAAA
jgi:hypothetical protein